MKVFKDGDQWCIAEDDFINLQESPCAFVPVDSLMGRLIAHFEESKKGNESPSPLVPVPSIWTVPFPKIDVTLTVTNVGGSYGWLII